MIISPPFLPAPASDEDAFIRSAMPDSSDLAPSSGGAPMGSYPLTTAMTWHNGLHIEAPRDAQGACLPVRAIADGTVIFKHEPRASNTDAADPQNYNPFGTTAAWTDNGMVIIRHQTDIGAAGATATSVTYYSVYMHLSRIESTVVKDRPIWRKDAIGTAGRIYGKDHHLHFEICLNEAELQKLVGTTRPVSWMDPAAVPTADGRTDAVFGSLYVYLPAGTPTSISKPIRAGKSVRAGTKAPTDNLRRSTPTGGASAATDRFTPDTLRAAQWVEIRYERGNATVSSYRAAAGGTNGQVGDLIGQPQPEPNYEYDLYSEANDRHDSLDAAEQALSSPSGWYELLRFGRNLGPDPLPANAAHWRQIPTDGGSIWADLNAPGTFKFSDADFPAFLGWQCFGDDTSHDNQRCDSVQIKKMLRDPKTEEIEKERTALAARLGTIKVREKLKRSICKFPTEWNKTTIVKRYDWLLADEEFKIDQGKEWNEYKAHCESISFDNLPAEYMAADWHVHPRTFVQQMRHCLWLSKDEMIQLLPMNSLRNASPNWVWENVSLNGAAELLGPTPTANSSRTELNIALRKYLVETRERLVCFFGNAAQETQWFQKFHEGSPYWYKPWDGRGFLQLTHATNYIKYWGEFRNRTITSSEKSILAAHTAQANNNRQIQNGHKSMFDPKNSLSDSSTGISAALIGLRDSVKTDPFARADSAGAYWAWSGAAKEADGLKTAASNSRNSKATTQGVRSYYLNTAFARVAATVNVGAPSNNFSSIWGIEARFLAYANAAVVVLDNPEFPQSDGTTKNTPENFNARKP